jgi:hypothetical protein
MRAGPARLFQPVQPCPPTSVGRSPRLRAHVDALALWEPATAASSPGANRVQVRTAARHARARPADAPGPSSPVGAAHMPSVLPLAPVLALGLYILTVLSGAPCFVVRGRSPGARTLCSARPLDDRLAAARVRVVRGRVALRHAGVAPAPRDASASGATRNRPRQPRTEAGARSRGFGSGGSNLTSSSGAAHVAAPAALLSRAPVSSPSAGACAAA